MYKKNILLFSVIIPVYNCEKYLLNCVNSVLKQKFKSIEIIIINDNSNQKTKKICERLKKNKIFKIINNKKNYGASYSRNLGIKHASGKYIIFIDGDDYIANNTLNKLSNLITKFKNPEVIICKFDHTSIYEMKRKDFKFINNKKNLKNSEGIFGTIEKKYGNLNISNFPSMWPCWRYIVLRKYILKNKLKFEEKARKFEDQEYTCNLIFKAKRFVFFKQSYYFYRYRSDSLFRSVDIKPFQICVGNIILISNILKFYKKNRLMKQKEFFYITIKNLLEYFYMGLISLKEKEIRFLSIFFLKNRISKHINGLTFSFNKTKESFFESLKSNSFNHTIKIYKENIVIKLKKILNLIEHRQLCIYTAWSYSFALLSLLKKLKIKVWHILDSNPENNNKKINGVKIKNDLIFKNKNKNFLSKTLILVCHPQKKTYLKIRNKLIKFGLMREKIIHFYF